MERRSRRLGSQWALMSRLAAAEPRARRHRLIRRGNGGQAGATPAPRPHPELGPERVFPAGVHGHYRQSPPAMLIVTARANASHLLMTCPAPVRDEAGRTNFIGKPRRVMLPAWNIALWRRYYPYWAGYLIFLCCGDVVSPARFGSRDVAGAALLPRRPTDLASRAV